ncbi:transposase, partial [Nostoc sp. CHAB 5784]|uniref:IS66 family transposase n=1 Tax=Nostoc mirabile TaxID=2907820 RepID=UPI001E57F9AD
RPQICCCGQAEFILQPIKVDFQQVAQLVKCPIEVVEYHRHTLLNQWIGKAGATAGNLLRSLRDKAHQWWYFLDYPEVPPDNNQAERSLRLAVTKRKVSGGSRSMERFQHTADLLTVVQTCRRQGKSIIDFFVQALLVDSNNYLSPPSLLPKY